MVAGAACAEGPVKVVVVWCEEMTIELCDTEEQFQSITVLQLKEKFKERLIGKKAGVSFDFQPAWHRTLAFTHYLTVRS